MKNAIALRVAGAIFLLVSIMHLLRFILKINVTITDFTVPLWVSIFGFIIALMLSLWMFKSPK